MIFKKIASNRTAEAIIAQLEGLVLEGVLRVGDRLPAERELAARMDVSRPVLREALKDMEDRNLIEARHGGGTYIANVIGTVFSDAIVSIIHRHPKALADYFEFRRDLEGMTAAHAANRATDIDRQILTRIFNQMKKYHETGTLDQEIEADIEFHMAIGEASHNMMLLHTLRSCYKLLVDGVFYSRKSLYGMQGVQEIVLEQHQAIYDAIMNRDSVSARNAAVDHIAYVELTLSRAEKQDKRASFSQMRLEQMDLREKPRRRSIASAPANPETSNSNS
ncbi:MAG: FCD domain-containing protein [Cohaesibacteraceae bacterium]|nr:FCD domain-containing protein [Cohaesibacteraceae bacterium]MBL4874983.1 FCD domain-containing protein [Cohaesibacteraceae bacterium]